MRRLLLFSLALGLTMPTYAFFDANKGIVALGNHASWPNAALVLQNTITGTVSGPNGPIAGATVSVVGKSVTTVTDDNGKFTITAAVGAKLRFSFVGYQPKEVSVTGSTVNVSLESGEDFIDEVVVVGYGSQKKEHLTGAVSSVNVEKTLGSRPIPDAGRGLQGAIPGLSVVVPTGEVGSDPIMKIRGQVASIAGSSNPLILVDNVEIPSINLINPNDIESISVLKDAASSSIYGSKAAFGVILITTKKGASSDVVNISYSNNLSLQSPFKDIEIAGIDGLEYTLEAHENMQGAGPAGGFWRVSRESLEKIREWQNKYGGVIGNEDPVVYGRDWYFDGVDKFGYRIYDPAAVMIKDNAFSHLHNLGLNGKTGNTTYNLSAGYLGQQGMMKAAQHDDFTRYNATLNISTKLNDFLTVRGGAMYSDGTKRNSNSATGFTADPWLYLYRWSRLFPIGVQENGVDIRDPYFDTKKAHTAYKIDRYTNLNLGTTINIMNGWDLQADYAYSTQNNANKSSMPSFTGKSHWYAPIAWNDENGNRIYVDENGVPTDNGGIAGYEFPSDTYITKAQSNIYRRDFFSKRHTFNAISTYNKNLEGGHDLKLMLGTNIVAYQWEDEWLRRTNLINEENPQFNFATGVQTNGADTNWDSQVGFFGRANYAYKDKYLFEANLRYDGSSKFPSDLRWRWFPSVSAGWVVSNENFMQDISHVLSFAKLRGSWGNIGDQSVANSLYVPTMNINKGNWLDDSGNPMYYLSTPGAVRPDILWQDIEHMNVGADLRFFNKLGVVVEWFKRNTNNMIIPGETLPGTFGAGSPQGNFGNLSTKGWEVNVDYNHTFENGLRLSANANIADAVTMTTKGTDWNTPWENRSIGTTFSTGRRYGDIYGYVTDRLFQKEDFIYDDNGAFVPVTIIHEGSAKITNQLAGDNPVYQTYFEDGNVLKMSPGDVKFVDVNGDGYITPGKGTNGDPGDRVVIGNSTPRFEYGFRLGADFKGFDLSVFMQGVGKREIWGDGQLAIPGYHVKDGAMPQAIAGDFWKEDRTDAFYPRAWNLNGANEGYVMRPQTRYLLDMSYFKIKNITFGYALQANVLDRLHLKNARIYVSLENFFTFDNLRGLPIDPETISGNSMLLTNGNYNLGRTGTGNPSFKSASMGIQIGL